MGRAGLLLFRLEHECFEPFPLASRGDAPQRHADKTAHDHLARTDVHALNCLEEQGVSRSRHKCSGCCVAKSAEVGRDNDI